MNTTSLFSTSVEADRVSKPAAALEITAVAGLVALGALVKFPLPFTPIPVTLQTFAVLLAASLVSPRRALAGIALYIGLGLAGMPWFAVVSGATAGYLAAFMAVPFIVPRFKKTWMGMTAAMACVYVLGAGWLCLGLGMSPWQAVVAGVAPFLAGDAIKISAAAAVANALKR